jgi:hypothetical protein
MNSRIRLLLICSWQRDRVPSRRRMATASCNAADDKAMPRLSLRTAGLPSEHHASRTSTNPPRVHVSYMRSKGEVEAAH